MLCFVDCSEELTRMPSPNAVWRAITSARRSCRPTGSMRAAPPPRWWRKGAHAVSILLNVSCAPCAQLCCVPRSLRDVCYNARCCMHAERHAARSDFAPQANSGVTASTQACAAASSSLPATPSSSACSRWVATACVRRCAASCVSVAGQQPAHQCSLQVSKRILQAQAAVGDHHG